MLRPLLLLCWAATIVSAGVQENANGTSVHTNLAGDSVAANAQTTSIVHPLPAGQDAHAPAEPKVEPQPNLPSNGGEHTTSDSTEEPNVITPPTKPPTISTKATTSRSVTLTTTTSKPITTPTPTSTTVAPTTTPTPVPTTPLPPPSTGRWKVWKGNTTLCILVQMAAQFNVSYTNAKNVTIHKAMDIPDNGTVTGNCGEIEQNLTVSWGSQNKSQDNFTLHFIKNETEKHYSLHHFEISLAAKEFPNDKLNKTVTLVHVAPQFTTGLSNSYRCIKEQQLNLTLKGSNVTVGLLKVTNLQFQAFRGDNTTNFGLAKDCSFDTPDIVPITVGCALAGLVVIVLIAYLVGRRRSQARGYLSM